MNDNILFLKYGAWPYQLVDNELVNSLVKYVEFKVFF